MADTISRSGMSGRSKTYRSSKNQAPPVVPLYMLEKYHVKPSMELKKKRLREKQAIEEVQMKMISANNLRKRFASGSALTIKKSKGNQSGTFRGCMLRSHVNPKQPVIAGKNPYESSQFTSPLRNTNNLLM